MSSERLQRRSGSEPAVEGAPSEHLHAVRTNALDTGYTSTVVHGVSVTIERGTCTALIGPNGCGKSTLLRTLARVLRPHAGTVVVDGDDIRRLRTRQLACRIGVLHQGAPAPEAITVRQLVEQGRYPHAGPLSMLRLQDDPVIDEALTAVDLTDFAHRPVDELSGGERQRAWLALTLAQQAAILLLDEPTTFLDIGHQMETLDLIRRLQIERRLTVLAVLHDLNHAFSIAQRVIVMDSGRIVATGNPDTVVTPDLLRDVFGVHAHIDIHHDSGVRYVVTLGTARTEPGEPTGRPSTPSE